VTERSAIRSLGLLADLVRALDWYDTSLQRVLTARGLRPVNRTQSIMLIHVAEGVTRPSAIAQRMGTTRQNVHAMARQLLEDRIIEIVPDPDDGRSRRYAFCAESRALRASVLEVLAYLDGQLEARLGSRDVRALRRILARDWGPAIDE
jgi:DNA-binding MarR family transcriptional regulator